MNWFRRTIRSIRLCFCKAKLRFSGQLSRRVDFDYDRVIVDDQVFQQVFPRDTRQACREEAAFVKRIDQARND